MATENIKKIKLLLVEDDEDFGSALSLRLKKGGCEVFLARSAEEGLQRLKEAKPDVVVADIKLPGMDGVEFLAKVRELDAHLPVILLTGYASLESAKEAVKLNAFDYLLKPLETIEELLNPINKAAYKYMLVMQDKKLTDELARNIVERKKSEDALRQAAQEWKATFDSITDLVAIVDKDCRFARVNMAFAKVLRVGPETIVGQYCRDMTHAKAIATVLSLHEETFRTKEPSRAEYLDSAVGRYFEASTSPVFDSRNKVIASVHIIKDITHRKEMENAQRLAQLGRLIADMAHEFNNPLMVISGRSQLSLMETIENQAVKKNLAIIRDECQRAKNIIEKALEFSKPTKGEPKRINVNDVFERALSAVGRRFAPDSVTLKKDYAQDLPPIVIDERQIEEVFFNLLDNARDAMRGEGVIEARTCRQDDFVRIELKDNGEGMSEEVLSKIFEPFFTTKEKGTGLGLPICHRIINDHGGKIEFRSSPGKGTTASILLPAGKEHVNV